MSKRHGGKKRPGSGTVNAGVERIKENARAYKARNHLVHRSRRRK